MQNGRFPALRLSEPNSHEVVLNCGFSRKSFTFQNRNITSNKLSTDARFDLSGRGQDFGQSLAGQGSVPQGSVGHDGKKLVICGDEALDHVAGLWLREWLPGLPAIGGVFDTAVPSPSILRRP